MIYVMSGTITFSSLRWCQKNAFTVKHGEILFWMSKWQKEVLKEIVCFYNLSLIFVAFPSRLLVLMTFSDVSSSEAQNSGCKRSQLMFLPAVTSHSGSRPASSLPLSLLFLRSLSQKQSELHSSPVTHPDVRSLALSVCVNLYILHCKIN